MARTTLMEIKKRWRCCCCRSNDSWRKEKGRTSGLKAEKGEKDSRTYDERENVEREKRDEKMRK